MTVFDRGLMGYLTHNPASYQRFAGDPHWKSKRSPCSAAPTTCVDVVSTAIIMPLITSALTMFFTMSVAASPAVGSSARPTEIGAEAGKALSVEETAKTPL